MAETENWYCMSDTGQNLKIGIKMQYNPCVLFYTSKVSKSYGSLIFIYSVYVRSGWRLVSTCKPHLSSNNYCNTFVIHYFLRQQLNLYTVSLSFRHQYPLSVFLLTLTILEGQDYKERVRNLKDVLVTLEKLEWLLCIGNERKQFRRNHQIFRGFPDKCQELGGTQVTKREMDWTFWASIKKL
jgi:hypothetical protein